LKLLTSLDHASAKYGGVTIMGGVPSYWRTGRFVTLDADGCPLPSDWYLSLAGAATASVHSGMQPSTNLPLPLP
jgi:hypothetical protein